MLLQVFLSCGFSLDFRSQLFTVWWLAGLWYDDVCVERLRNWCDAFWEFEIKSERYDKNMIGWVRRDFYIQFIRAFRKNPPSDRSAESRFHCMPESIRWREIPAMNLNQYPSQWELYQMLIEPASQIYRKSTQHSIFWSPWKVFSLSWKCNRRVSTPSSDKLRLVCAVCQPNGVFYDLNSKNDFPIVPHRCRCSLCAAQENDATCMYGGDAENWEKENCESRSHLFGWDFRGFHLSFHFFLLHLFSLLFSSTMRCRQTMSMLSAGKHPSPR